MTTLEPTEGVRILVGDVRERLAELADESVHCVVTSPPYWGLRDYGTGGWEDGDPECDHGASGARRPDERRASTLGGGVATLAARDGGSRARDTCANCGAVRIDLQVGLERTPDEYVATIVGVLREVRRVLRRDGTLWLNLGDSYNNRARTRETNRQPSLNDFEDDVCAERAARGGVRMSISDGDLKEKDLVGVPWMVSFALRADGWYLRAEVIWDKPNPMPESVTSRPTKAHEQVFLLARSPRYFYDAEAVREPHTSSRWGGPTITQPDDTKYAVATADGFAGAAEALSRPGREWNAYPAGGRNLRSVWRIATEPYPDAHFATFPTKLVEPCVLAGTSACGVCPDCGAPWEREVERETMIVRPGPGRVEKVEANGDLARTAVGGTVERPSSSRTVGWRPTCECHGYLYRWREVDPETGDLVARDVYVWPDPRAEAREAGRLVPATVLDPFGGSGTVAVVAKRLGRGAVLVELSAAYADLAARRVARWWDRPARRREAPQAEALFDLEAGP